MLRQAHDFEAYQEMLRETAPPGSSAERFEVISKFLSTTEEYLNRLSSKVASVKMTQEASEAAALAVSKARAQVSWHPLAHQPRTLGSPRCGNKLATEDWHLSVFLRCAKAEKNSLILV